MKIKVKELERRSRAFSDACRRYGLKSTYQRAEIYRELATRKNILTWRRSTPGYEVGFQLFRSIRSTEPFDCLREKGSSHASGLPVKERALMQTVLTITILSVPGVDSWEIFITRNNDFRPSDVGMGTVNSVHVEIRGICKKCQKKKGSSK
jgi:hypothetical protein